MSTATEVPEAVELARRLMKLAQEYTERLSASKRQAYDLLLNANADASLRAVQANDLKTYAAQIRPAAEQLIRQASQFVEHGAVDSTTRVELRLRLVELEHALASIRDAVAALRT